MVPILRPFAPSGAAQLAPEYAALSPRLVLAPGCESFLVTEGVTTPAPLLLGGTRVATQHGPGVQSCSATITAYRGEIAHPPCTMMVWFRMDSVQATGSESAVGLVSSVGDEFGITNTPYLWTANLRRNYAGPQFSSASSGAAMPSAGKSYFLVVRSHSDTDHELLVWRSDGGYERATATTSTAAISYIDPSNFTSTARVQVYGYALFDQAVPDEMLALLRTSPRAMFAPEVFPIPTATLAAAVTLVVADLALAVQMDAPTLTQTHMLAVQDGSVGMQMGAPALTQAHLLAMSDLGIAITADHLTLSESAIVLTVSDATLRVLMDRLRFGAATPSGRVWTVRPETRALALPFEDRTLIIQGG